MSDNNYTEQLANYVFSFDNMPLPSLPINQVKKALMDYLCSSITGSKTEVSNKLYQYLINSSDTDTSTSNAIGYEKRLTVESAAFINGTSAHCLDFDDGHTEGSFHPGSVVFPAVLSCAQEINASSEKMIRSILIGYEISTRISSAIHPSSRKRGFHNTPIAGIFGATAAISYLYKLELKEVQQAFGIAGSFASGLFAFLGSGSEIKRLHPGKAAHDAIKAVKLVQSGISGPETVIEDKNGVFQAFAGGEISVSNLLNDLGDTFKINNIYFKPYPCCRHLHSTIDAIFKLKKNHEVKISNVKEVRIGVNGIAYLHNHKQCDSFIDAQMSLPYAASVALVFDSLNIDSFDPSQVPKEVWDICENTHVYIDKDAEKGYPEKRLADVEIIMESGNSLKEIVEIPLGEPTNPLSDKQLEAKFLDNCIPIVGKEKAEQFIENLRDWPEVIENNHFLFEL